MGPAKPGSSPTVSGARAGGNAAASTTPLSVDGFPLVTAVDLATAKFDLACAEVVEAGLLAIRAAKTNAARAEARSKLIAAIDEQTLKEAYDTREEHLQFHHVNKYWHAVAAGYMYLKKEEWAKLEEGHGEPEISLPNRTTPRAPVQVQQAQQPVAVGGPSSEAKLVEKELTREELFAESGKKLFNKNYKRVHTNADLAEKICVDFAMSGPAPMSSHKYGAAQDLVLSTEAFTAEAMRVIPGLAHVANGGTYVSHEVEPAKMQADVRQHKALVRHVNQVAVYAAEIKGMWLDELKGVFPTFAAVLLEAPSLSERVVTELGQKIPSAPDLMDLNDYLDSAADAFKRTFMKLHPILVVLNFEYTKWLVRFTARTRFNLCQVQGSVEQTCDVAMDYCKALHTVMHTGQTTEIPPRLDTLQFSLWRPPKVGPKPTKRDRAGEYRER